MTWLHRYFNRRYLPNYVHARKLFFFDSLLLVSMLLITIVTVFWYIYDPTVLDDITLGIRTDQKRLQSGDTVALEIPYENNSPIELQDVLLFIDLPPGFELTQGNTSTIFLGTLNPKDKGNFRVEGSFVATPKKSVHILARLRYRQREREVTEEKISALMLMTQQGATTLNISGPTTALAGGTVPMSITLSNQGKTPIDILEIPLEDANTALYLRSAVTNSGSVSGTLWTLQNLQPGSRATLSADYFISEQVPDSLVFSLTPVLRFGNDRIKDETFHHPLRVVHPRLRVSVESLSAQTTEPKATVLTRLHLTNEGAESLTNLRISMPIAPDIIDAETMARQNRGTYHGSNISLGPETTPSLLSLHAGQSISFDISFPIRPLPNGGTDITFSPAFRVQASVSSASQSTFETLARAEQIRIGTQMILDAETRYYTNEGDQLGRGPLPPVVGKETKYGLLITLRNTTSKLNDISLAGTLHPATAWTGKTSVSHGQNIAFDQKSKTFRWYLKELNAHDNAQLFIELGITPKPEDVGTSPILIDRLTATAFDTFIDAEKTASISKIDTSLPTDSRARSKGVLVE